MANRRMHRSASEGGELWALSPKDLAAVAGGSKITQKIDAAFHKFGQELKKDVVTAAKFVEKQVVKYSPIGAVIDNTVRGIKAHQSFGQIVKGDLKAGGKALGRDAKVAAQYGSIAIPGVGAGALAVDAAATAATAIRAGVAAGRAASTINKAVKVAKVANNVSNKVQNAQSAYSAAKSNGKGAK